jgi:hypothetical protein
MPHLRITTPVLDRRAVGIACLALPLLAFAVACSRSGDASASSFSAALTSQYTALMKPSGGLGHAKTNTVGCPFDDEWTCVSDGTSLAANDPDKYVYSTAPGGKQGQSYSSAPAGSVTTVTTNVVAAAQSGASGTVTVTLYDGSELIGTGAAHPLTTSYAVYSDSFDVSVTSANSLRTWVTFSSADLKFSEIWLAATSNVDVGSGSDSGKNAGNDGGKDAGDDSGKDSGRTGSDAGAPLLFEDFNPSDFSGVDSTNGVWRISGPWVGTGNNYLTPANAKLTSTYDGQSGGYLLLTVAPTANTFSGTCPDTASSANPCQGAEIQTYGTTSIVGSDLNGSTLDYGYYEVRMKVTSVPGVVVSFFWKQINYAVGEIDYEFLTDEPWATMPSIPGTVHLTVHGNSGSPSQPQTLTFNPTADFHRYGFLWTPTEVEYVIDGQKIYTFSGAAVAAIPGSTGGYIMMNTWTGDATWGGGPPTENATSEYDWVKFWPNVTTIPAE